MCTHVTLIAIHKPSSSVTTPALPDKLSKTIATSSSYAATVVLSNPRWVLRSQNLSTGHTLNEAVQKEALPVPRKHLPPTVYAAKA
ncbi:uncharacterized protein PHALS_09576 [Plasmopara halstedii]|uniref:Uncharacterized protein n=1 Tax=Plasmopara halstedii TaxID=4781 RepID=A0A0P1AFD6_PLAHL|nr:uncharacterized protein PHALS_09576 [Plasmopara halstedii]CEG39322.1 hypothetical protein PHALS_09576 [Plasmopara halstedii]|eukprot:XP_024575691.1 hypothetical protein PHALS_09576 [Plasmopara halstedii]